MYDEMKVLKFALDSGIVNSGTIEKLNDDMIAKEKLNNHYYSWWKCETDGRYKTYVDTIDGSRKLIAKRTVEELAEAINDNSPVRHHRHKHRSFRDRTHSVDTVENLFKAWVERKLRHREIKKQSYDKYSTDFVRFFKNGVVDISQEPIGTFTELDIEDFIKDSIVHFNMNAKAYARLRLLIIGIFKYAKKMGKTKISISAFFGDLDLPRSIFAPRNRLPEHNVFTDKEVEMICAYVENLDNPDVLDYGVLLAFFTGMRSGELVALQWRDIGEDCIYITKTEERIKDENGNYVYQIRNSGKTEASTRSIVLTDYSKNILRKLRVLNPFGEYIFEDRHRRRYNGKKPTVRLYQICEKLGIHKRSLHKARKTYITKLINAGVEETVILNQAGHTDIQTTRSYYEFNNRTVGEIKEQVVRALAQ